MKLSIEIGNYLDPKNGKPCEVEIYFDKDGLDYLINQLSKLKASGDHSHLMTPSWGMHDLSETKIVEENHLAHHLRLSLL